MDYSLKPREKLTKARVSLNKDKPFFGYLTMRLNFVETKSIPSLGVDKFGNCYYNKEFVDDLSQEKINAVLCHEVMHCALKHLERDKGKDRELWNISTDAVINSMLKKDGASFPENSILPDYYGTIKLFGKEIKKCHKKSANEVYDKLYNEWKDLKKKTRKAINNAWDKHIYKGNSNSGKSEKSDKNEGESDGLGVSDKDINTENVDWEEELAAASSQARMKGNLPAGCERLIDELLDSKIDWKGLLYKYITNALPFDYTWKRKSKKSYSTGVYLPNVKKEKVDLIVSIDTSGSISKKDLKKFSSELLGIANSFENLDLTIIYNDTEVYGPYNLRNPTSEDIIRLRPKGGGGTNHIPVFKWAEENKESNKLLVCFTDGYTSFPENPSIETVWILAGRHIDKDGIPFGRVIELPR